MRGGWLATAACCWRWCCGANVARSQGPGCGALSVCWSEAVAIWNGRGGLTGCFWAGVALARAGRPLAGCCARCASGGRRARSCYTRSTLREAVSVGAVSPCTQREGAAR
ncbi:hypothetical protein B0J12DRAFT_670612 [Macrophomina phaseolina]|uniref:Secreted protein n=1 Tax=Macrophomina phaseolina TaxID=35725 RepID=A0ABQ8G7D3_9PEZI|nr:hypothetical protein B0J12DRAFT_670612 [Macrophomina phaseolina]